MGGQTYENFYARGAALSKLREQIRDSEEIVALAAPVELIREIEDVLWDALDRGVLVLLLLASDELTYEDVTTREFPATIVRYWEPRGIVVTSGMIDYHSGLITVSPLYDPDAEVGRTFAYHDEFFGNMQLTSLVVNFWRRGDEVYAADPRPLPHTYDSFFYAVIDAAKRLRDRHDLYATVSITDGSDRYGDSIDGPVINVRQNIVYPMTNSFPAENSMFVECERGVVSIGGPSATVEDVGASAVKLYEGDGGNSSRRE
ncbi:TrmB family transcriptional regulator sugar-binding domain-containing protein [Natrarchaeobius oligotrophus]|uniref:Transcription regulator TrmB C-terminal domain-containing protein n=1 Tax=Natrarchaeobius chitinivorans TaxID=1679083 RepID=A0A3N6NQ57_NATCH|nr:TrmB family transcriptional regulator sugar-binding domain-containing protein [Natrarchaeobius chitinivorans]RQH01923.1 hypothetical protein EA472_06355 [Natrarchaeobius chitinivorans]